MRRTPTQRLKSATQRLKSAGSVPLQGKWAAVMAVTEWSIPLAHLHGEQRLNRPIEVYKDD